MRRRFLVVALIAAPLAVSPAASASPVDSPTGSAVAASSTRPGSDCTKANLLHSLPNGSTIKKYACATAGKEKWAAVLLNQGPTLYLERYVPKGKHWNVYMAEEICGTASAGLPAKILNFCKYA